MSVAVHGGATLSAAVDRSCRQLSNVRDERTRPEGAVERKARCRSRSTVRATLSAAVDRRREQLPNVRDERRRPQGAVEGKAARRTSLTVTSKYHFGRPTYLPAYHPRNSQHRRGRSADSCLLHRNSQRHRKYRLLTAYCFLPTTSLETVNTAAFAAPLPAYYLEAVDAAAAAAVAMSVAVAAQVARIMEMSAPRVATDHDSCIQFVNRPCIKLVALVVGAHLASDSSSGLTPELLHSSLAHTCQTSYGAIDATRKCFAQP